MNIIGKQEDINSECCSGMPELDVCGRRLSCYFYNNVNGHSSCRALIDFYNAGDVTNQCGNCPFYKTEIEFMSGWNGGVDYEEDELEEII